MSAGPRQLTTSPPPMEKPASVDSLNLMTF